jgi:hypothetical protein
MCRLDGLDEDGAPGKFVSPFMVDIFIWLVVTTLI